MFLWVRLVLHTVENLFYERDVRDAIETLPEGLYPLYDVTNARPCLYRADSLAAMTRYFSTCAVTEAHRTSAQLHESFSGY